MEKVTIFEPADIQIYVRGKGIVLKEKSLIAFRMEGNKIKVAAVGNEAAVPENLPQDITVVSPLHQGRIADFIVAEKLFQCLITRAAGRHHFMKPRAALCFSDNEVYDEVSLKAYKELMYMACGGLSELILLPETMEEVLKKTPEEVLKKYKLIIGIGKDKTEDYVRERVKETVQYAMKNGVSGENVIEMIRKMEFSE